MPDYPDAAYCSIAPDWICEVLSPSTRRVDRHEKAEIYAREGVSHLWLVDPDAKALEAFELRDGHWVLLATLADDEPVSQPPFEAIAFPLDALWPEGAGRDGCAARQKAQDRVSSQGVADAAPEKQEKPPDTKSRF